MLPMEFFYKVILGGLYAVFTHFFRNGGYSTAFKAAYVWLRTSAYESAHAFDIQCYDAGFTRPDNPDSVLGI